MEGEGFKKFFKIVYNKVLKPIGSEAMKNIKKDPIKALKIGYSTRVSYYKQNILLLF